MDENLLIPNTIDNIPTQQEQMIDPQVPQVPQYDAQAMFQRMEALQAQQAQLAGYIASKEAEARRIAEANKPVNDEDQAILTVKDKLGLSNVEKQIAELKELQAQQAEFVRQQQISSFINDALSQYGQDSLRAVEAHLVELNKSNPSLAQSLNTADGIKYLLSTIGKQVQPQRQPDQVVVSRANPQTPQSNPMVNIMNGSYSDEDLAMALIQSSSPARR